MVLIHRALISFSCSSASCFLFSQNSRSKLVLHFISFVLQVVAVLRPAGRRAVDNNPETTACKLHLLIHSGSSYSQLIRGDCGLLWVYLFCLTKA